jgi:hypothetical protein
VTRGSDTEIYTCCVCCATPFVYLGAGIVVLAKFWLNAVVMVCGGGDPGLTWRF